MELKKTSTEEAKHAYSFADANIQAAQ